MKICGMLRIKNEERWIEKVLRSMLPACRQIFVFDDHSIDSTPEICQSIEQVKLFHSPFQDLNEARDKNWLLEIVEQAARAGDFILSIDGDEEIAPGGCELIQLLAEKSNGADAYRFQVLYLWNRPDQIRADRWYRDYRRPSLFRFRPGARFHSRTSGGFHCGNVPEPNQIGDCGIRLIHWGYMHREDRIRKWNFYNCHDPVNHSEGYDPRFPERRSYPHIVQGDIPEVPAEAVLMHAGPLKLEALGI